MTIQPRTITDVAGPSGARAQRYWRAVCALAGAHVLGTTWPPPGRQQPTRTVGHWGCNPGIAWIAGHLAEAWTGADPIQFVVGTGHASSFLFGHHAVADAWSADQITAACARYGVVGGDPAELFGLPGVPYSGGELGPALAVSQGMASVIPDRLVTVVIGDGECETPSALAALAHADVLLGPDTANWLPVVNMNGARMGGRARFDTAALTRLLTGLGRRVLVSGTDVKAAVTAATAAITACQAGERVVWLSVTDKGWPAPERVANRRFRGNVAHKPPSAWRDSGPSETDVAEWFAILDPGDTVGESGTVAPDVVELAGRLTIRLPDTVSRPTEAPLPRRARPMVPSTPDWAAPMSAVDRELADRRIAVFSPDEAESNGLTRCLAAGTVTEVLAEEICAAWTWGAVEAGRPAAFVTYEAFAPLAGSVLAQYAKLTCGRPTRAIPPLLVIATSLGWANSPTHQNTDITAIVAARPGPQATVVYPVGATSAAGRVAAAADRRRDGVVLVVSSKQRLLDLPDPGGAVVRYRIAGAGSPVAAIIATGDVCATEAVAAAAVAAEAGVAIDVVALIDLAELDPTEFDGLPRAVVAATPTAPDHVAAHLWRAAGRVFPVHGYREAWGPTAWETLRANRLDRVSLLVALAKLDVPVPRHVIEAARERVADWLSHGTNLAGVAPFTCPPLVTG